MVVFQSNRFGCEWTYLFFLKSAFYRARSELSNNTLLFIIRLFFIEIYFFKISLIFDGLDPDG